MNRNVECVKIVYHHEDGIWWAESDNMPGFYAAGNTFGEVRKNVRSGVDFYFDDGLPRVLEEYTEDGAVLMDGNHKIYIFPSNVKNGLSNQSQGSYQSISSSKYSEARLVA